MPERDGSTCPTCLTLNPAAAPACVRCNTPLGTGTLPPGPAPTDTGAVPARGAVPAGRAAGPGAEERSRGALGSSLGRGAADRRPAPGPGDPEPGRPEPVTRETAAREAAAGEVVAGEVGTVVARRVTVVGLVLVGLVLAVGGGALWLTRPGHLDSSDVEVTVGAELSERGGGAVTVSCPGGRRHRPGDTFPCVASDTAGGRRTLTVTVLDGDGRYRWSLDR